jgi:hypothetical protein
MISCRAFVWRKRDKDEHGGESLKKHKIESPKEDPFIILPNELLGAIFLWLPSSLQVLCSLRLVSKRWKDCVEVQYELWKSLYGTRFPEEMIEDEETKDWFARFSKRTVLDSNWKTADFQKYALEGTFGTVCRLELIF